MSKLRSERLAEQYKDQYPAFPSYLQCQSRAFLYGLATFTLSFAVTFFVQELNKKRIPYAPKYFLVPPMVVASLASWNVSRRKTHDCQLMWMAAEDKHTALTSLGPPGTEPVPVGASDAADRKASLAVSTNHL
ncbi:hypothetical protein RvY_14688 [Ramazzottius varieornatus]|uniref:Uncharacterized protein n=1 Tax=Ramazzottius varieornatus TaxID=947166 RepID=A0A1D1VU17_RAMVA|nr:hypothetical protein RvY_14688 [Ramazzottius varieornatus]